MQEPQAEKIYVIRYGDDQILVRKYDNFNHADILLTEEQAAQLESDLHARRMAIRAERRAAQRKLQAAQRRSLKKCFHQRAEL